MARRPLPLLSVLAAASFMAVTPPPIRAQQLQSAKMLQCARPGAISILNPADLMNARPDTDAGAILRSALSGDARWIVNPESTQIRILSENGIPPDSACTEFQCGFDAGNALQTEFVLFGTVAPLQDVFTFTLSLVHVPTSQIVWSRSGDISRKDPERSGKALRDGLGFAVASLDPAALQLRRMPTLGLMAVMDAGRPSAYSRVALARALSHAYASRAYDLLGPAELASLMGALDIRGNSPDGEPEDMFTLGTKMGVRYLLWTNVKEGAGRYRMEVSLYDVAARKLLRHWPSRETRDFGDLLGLEDHFLTALAGDQSQPPPASAPHRVSHWKTIGKYASVALAIGAGGGMGYYAYQSKRNADADYRAYRNAQSAQNAADARQRVLQEDVQARHYGMLGGISLALGVAVWVF
jgi:TolB-like protein